MSQYYNRLSALQNNYVINQGGQERRFRYIGQLIIRRVVTYDRYERDFRHFIEVNSFRGWSPYFLKFFEDSRSNQNDTTVFVTFSSAVDHLEFVRIFDEMRFGQYNGLTKELSVRVNGFTNVPQLNGDLGSIRFSREMIIAVKNFNNDLMRSQNNDDEDGFIPVQPLNFNLREFAAQRQLQIIRQRPPLNNNNNNNNYNNSNNNNNNNNTNNNNNNNSNKRQRNQVTPSTSANSIVEPTPQRQALVDIREITERFPLIPLQVNNDNFEWLQEFLRPKPIVQRAERENFDFYF